MKGRLDLTDSKETEQVPTTLVERFISFFPLPYWLATTIWVLFVTFGVGTIALYIDGMNLGSQLSGGLFENIADVGFYVAAFSYPFYIVRYTRRRILATESQLAPIYSDRKDPFRKAFRAVGSSTPILVMTILFAALGLSSFTWTSGPAEAVANFLVGIVFVFTYSTVGWVYFRSVWGLHTLGKQPARFKSFSEDAMLGTRPIGSLALALAASFLIPVTFFLFFFGNVGSSLAGDVPISNVLGLLPLVLLGVILFFLPLRSVHARMTEEKQRITAELWSQFSNHREAVMGDSSEAEATLGDIRTELRRVGNILALDLLKKEAGSIPTWPFDTRTLGRLAALILSVTVILLSAGIRDIFHF